MGEIAELEQRQDELLDQLTRLTGGPRTRATARAVLLDPRVDGESAGATGAEPPKGRRVTIRVVIAEDEAIIRMDLRETLEEEGYEVVGETGRGDTAVELVRELLPDLAILDIKMPGIDGLEAARIINAEKLCGVLVLTAFSQREVVEEARDAGALAYLVKPFQKSDLSRRSRWPSAGSASCGR